MSDYETYTEVATALGNKDYSPLLMHYSTFQNLEKILASKEFWFGDLEGMNDTKECDHFIEAIEESLHLLLAPDQIAAVKSIIQPYKNSIKENSFSSSWCEFDPRYPDGDNSMWQAYSGASSRIGLVIDSSQFLPSQVNAEKMAFYIFSGRVAYTNQSGALGLLSSDLENLSKIPSLHAIGGLGAMAAILLLAKAPNVKHYSFRNENEVRFLYSPPLFQLMGRDVPELDAEIIEKKELTRKFVKFPLQPYPQYDLDFSIERLLKKVIIGPPALNQEPVEKAVRRLLNDFGLFEVEVVRSQSSLR